VNSKHMSRLLLLVLFLCSLRLAPVYSSESGSPSPMNNGNYMNQNYIVLDGDWLYFAHFPDRWAYIYRMDLEGGNLSPIDTRSKMGVPEMFIYEQTLYFVSSTEWYRIDLKTLERRELVINWKNHRHQVHSAFPLQNGIIVNSIANHLLLVNYEGEVLWEIYPGRADNLNLDGEYLYFTDREKDDKLLRCKLDGSDLVEITQKAVDKVMVHQGWIYFTFTDSWGRLSKMKVNEYKAITLPPRLVQQYHICKDWLFFSGFMPNENHIPQSLYKMRIDESEMIRINDFPSTDIHVYDDKVFYRRAVGHNSEGLWMYDVSQKRHVRLDEAPTDLLPFELETISFEASSEPEEIETPANDEALQMENDTLPPQKPPVSPWPVLFFLIPAVVLAGIWGILVVKKRKP
jgi:hypothetical protein